MVEKVEGLVIDVVRHNDRHNIVSLYTRSRGRVSFLSPVASSRRSRGRNAMLMPLSCVSADVNFRSDRRLHTLPALSPGRIWHTLYFNPVKSSMLLFLSEFLNALLRYDTPDEALYRYLTASLEVLDALPAERVANFHIAFMTGMLDFMGIRPPVEDWRRGMIFDMSASEFRYSDVPGATFSAKSTLLGEEDAAYAALLGRMTYRNMHHFKLVRSQRWRLLSTLLRYYSLHLPFKPELKSLDVLKELFN